MGQFVVDVQSVHTPLVPHCVLDSGLPAPTQKPVVVLQHVPLQVAVHVVPH